MKGELFMSFTSFQFSQEILRAIIDMEYHTPTNIQAQTIPVILEGKDVLGRSHTGTGKTATSEQAQEMHAFIRKTVAEKYGEEVAEATSILYGGSCKPSNAKELFANKDVDGGLIGGASLDVEQFMGIVDAF